MVSVSDFRVGGTTGEGGVVCGECGLYGFGDCGVEECTGECCCFGEGEGMAGWEGGVNSAFGGVGWVDGWVLGVQHLPLER